MPDLVLTYLIFYGGFIMDFQAIDTILTFLKAAMEQHDTDKVRDYQRVLNSKLDEFCSDGRFTHVTR